VDSLDETVFDDGNFKKGRRVKFGANSGEVNPLRDGLHLSFSRSWMVADLLLCKVF
jgi:hypothetical protein